MTREDINNSKEVKCKVCDSRMYEGNLLPDNEVKWDTDPFGYNKVEKKEKENE